MTKEMTENKLLSIITINRNNAEGLRKTIQSVVEQECISENTMEYIIIDGDSTDSSIETIEMFLKKAEYSSKISYWISEKDTGIYNAMNKGIKKATGQYSLFLNSGDILANRNVIASVFDKLNTYDIISGVLDFSDGSKKRPHKEISCFKLMDDYIPHPSTFIRTELLKNNPYLEDYSIISDYIFFFQELLFNSASYTYIDNLISVFDNSGLSCTQSSRMQEERLRFFKENLPEYIRAEYNNYKKIEDLNILKYGRIVQKSKLLSFIVKAYNKILK